MLRLLLPAIILSLCSSLSFAATDNKVELSTYYPAPTGNYNNLTVNTDLKVKNISAITGNSFVTVKNNLILQYNNGASEANDCVVPDTGDSSAPRMQLGMTTTGEVLGCQVTGSGQRTGKWSSFSSPFKKTLGTAATGNANKILLFPKDAGPVVAGYAGNYPMKVWLGINSDNPQAPLDFGFNAYPSGSDTTQVAPSTTGSPGGGASPFSGGIRGILFAAGTGTGSGDGSVDISYMKLTGNQPGMRLQAFGSGISISGRGIGINKDATSGVALDVLGQSKFSDFVQFDSYIRFKPLASFPEQVGQMIISPMGNAQKEGFVFWHEVDNRRSYLWTSGLQATEDVGVYGRLMVGDMAQPAYWDDNSYKTQSPYTNKYSLIVTGSSNTPQGYPLPGNAYISNNLNVVGEIQKNGKPIQVAEGSDQKMYAVYAP